MSCRLIALSIDANDPLRLARFWSGVLGWGISDEPEPQEVLVLLSNDDTGLWIRFLPTQELKSGPKNARWSDQHVD